MLPLPNDWKQMLAGYLALQIVNRIANPVVQVEVCANLIAAAIELSATAEWIFRDKGVQPEFTELSTRCWKIKAAVYRFIPIVDDDSFFECLELCAKRNCPMLIVPTKHNQLMTSALREAASRMPSCIFAFDLFLSWRAMFATGNTGWSYCKYVRELIDCYNPRAASRNVPLIEVPSVSDGDP